METKPEIKALSKRSQILVALAAGLYPMIHYYNGNLEMADSWVQFYFLIGCSIGVPLLLMGITAPLFHWKPLRILAKYRVAAINLAVFCGLLSMLIFQSNRKGIALAMVVGALLSFVLYKFIRKVMVMQFLLALLALIMFVPKAWFAINHSNEWAMPVDDIASVSFKKHPNVYVIQPDGYASFETFRNAPYNYQDTAFQKFLEAQGFVSYSNFRSNYYSTLTSNSSLFAMRHHYYGNTYKGNLKTFDAQEIIAGNNPTLQAFKNNQYKTHLITDNSFFLINRKAANYDFINVSDKELTYYKPGRVRGVDMISDFAEVMKEPTTTPQFYFIEKTVPGHIAHGEGAARGIEAERDRYLQRVKKSEVWLRSLLTTIYEKDSNPMIIIVADHGGFVGLEYVKQVLDKKLNPVELNSAFSSMLSIQWPNGEVPENLSLHSSVNLFRNILSYLSEDEGLLQHMEEDSSFLPYDDGKGVGFYECIEENGAVRYKKL